MNIFIKQVRNVIEIIRSEAAYFTFQQKQGYDGGPDLVTSADLKAQESYLNFINDHWPDDGIIGEENLKRESKTGRYFTIDPLDGTKAFQRESAAGVGTMLAWVKDGEVILSIIGDVNSGEIFFSCPDKGDPLYIRFGEEKLLPMMSKPPVWLTFAAVRDNPRGYPQMIQDLVWHETGLFKGISIDNGSIGLMMGRLWKGEVGAVILPPHYETPWDSSAVIGVNRALGLSNICILDGRADVFEPQLITEIEKREGFWIVTRREYERDILDWVKNYKQ